MRGGIAYFLLTHRHPEQVARMVRVLTTESTNACVVIHHDRNGCELPRFASRLVSVLPDPLPISRGGMSLVRATLRGIDWIRRSLESAWIVLLSGQDYPVARLADVEAALASSPYDAYIRYQPPEQVVAMCAERYLRRWYAWRVPFRRRTHRFSRPYNLIFSHAFHCYKASTWWMLSRAAVDYLTEFLARHPEYWRQYERSFIPDESFIQTAVLNGPLRVYPDNMRLIRWGQAGARHPDVLSVRDWPLLAATPHWFARKFDVDVCSQVLDLLDAKRQGRAVDVEAHAPAPRAPTPLR